MNLVANNRAVPNNRTLEIRICTHRDIIADDGSRFNFDARSDAAVVANQSWGIDFGALVDVGVLTDPQSRRALFVGKVNGNFMVEGFVLRFSIGFEVTDVAPVVLGDVAEHRFAFFQQEREQVFRKVALFVGWQVFQDFRFEDVGPRIDRIGENLAGRRFLQKSLNPLFLVGNDDAKLNGVGNVCQYQRGFGTFFFVKFNGSGQIEVGDAVAANHQKRIVEKFFNIFNAACGAEGLIFLNGIGHLHAKVAAVLEVIPHDIGQIMDGCDHFPNVMPSEQIDNMLGNGTIQYRHHRFGEIAGERSQPRSRSSRHQHCSHKLSLLFALPYKGITLSRFQDCPSPRLARLP